MNAEQLCDVVVDALDDLRAQQPEVLDVSGLTGVTDYMVIASGSSGRQVKSLAEHVRTKAKEAGAQCLGLEGEDSADWVLVDFGDLVVHVMAQETRDFYELERLWRDPGVARSAPPS